jgi:hypothetical protein
MEREIDNPDEIIQKRLQEQAMQNMPARQMPSPMNQAQPVGAPTPFDPKAPGGYDSFVNPSEGAQPQGGNVLGGPNTGINGGSTGGGVAQAPKTGGLSPMAGGAMARYGTGNIGGAENVGRGNYMGQLEGFNTNAWDKAPEGYEANSIKNTFGKIASRYDVTQPGAVRSLMADPEFQQFFPEARIIEHPNGDLIDFGDGKPVDVIRAAVAGGSGQGWQWGADDGTGGGAAGAPGGATGGGGMDLQSILAGTDPLDDIMKRINDLNGGQTPDAERQALMQILEGI